MPLGRDAANAEELRHVVQFCGDEEPLLGDVTAYLSEGLARGGSILVIASPDRNDSLAGALHESGADLDRAARERRILFADSEQTLSRFMSGGMPDWRRFERTIGALLQQLQSPLSNGIRAYGEMVAVLWQRGEHTAAARLEQYWNRILAVNAVQLFCSYPIDVLSRNFQPEEIDPVLAEHSRVISAAGDHLAEAIERAMMEVLGSEAKPQLERFRASICPAWPVLADAEAIILWLRVNLPTHAEEILARAGQKNPEPKQSENIEPLLAPAS